MLDRRAVLSPKYSLQANLKLLQDLQQYGDAPVRPAPAGPDRQRYMEGEPRTTQPSHHHHIIHLLGHRHSRSKEEPPRPPSKDIPNGYPTRPFAMRHDSSTSTRVQRDQISSPMASMTALTTRGTSPTPSTNSGFSRDPVPGQRSPAEAGAGKRLLGKLNLRRLKPEKVQEPTYHPVGLTSQNDDGRRVHADFPSVKRSREGSIATFDSGSTTKPADYLDADSQAHKKSYVHPRLPKSRRGLTNENVGKEADRARTELTGNESLFPLDLDLDNMVGIVDPNVSSSKHLPGNTFPGASSDDGFRQPSLDFDSTLVPGSWDAPDSWAVKTDSWNVKNSINPPFSLSEEPVEDDGIPHCVRVFRIDSTFATLSTSINTTVSEVLQMLGKKSFLQDELDNYQIIMRKHDLQRQLAPGERPLAIQKRLLEQAGYLSSDRIEEIGREDNSYLCRFTFVPTKLGGYYSLEKEPSHMKIQKFSHVDLQGRNLVTIPITLYQKANDIVSLNLSRNLSLDVPKDFIQGCVNLRDIKYISNEAWHLPLSFSLATRLTVLDISNNCLEQLEHAELQNLQSLVSIKLSNNKLKHLPSYFSQYKSLRSLNVSSNYLDALPDFLCDLKSLVDLDISFNCISALPKIGHLKTLERLWATNNSISGDFGVDINELENLKEVDIRFNNITSIDVFTGLPRLEQLMVGHNSISKFEGSFAKIRILHLDHNPVTRFDFISSVGTLSSLNIASAKIAQLDDTVFGKMPNLTKLNMDKNHFVNLSHEIGKLRKLEYLSIAKNPLSSLPSAIGQLSELRFLDIRECNLKRLPSEMWLCLRLDTLNVSSNVLESFPQPPAAAQLYQLDPPSSGGQKPTGAATSPLTSSSYEDLGKLEDFGHRRPSQASAALLSVGSSPAGGTRSGSIVSIYGPGGRKASVIARSPTDGSICTISRKETNSSQQQRLATTFAGSLRNLYMADNRLTDDVFDEITMLTELRVLNLSYNELYDIPQRSLRRWQHLNELYLSGNELTSLPSDDLEEISCLKVLHLNGNKFQVLPAELGKVHKLAVLDVGSNSLKYNVSNWPYDWNWNWNRNLKYLNFSGNKRLEIKPSRSFAAGGGREGMDLTNFTSLQHLRVLGLMDVTLTIPSVPDQTDDRRVRTSGSLAGTMAYGMADSLGRHEHLSTIDMVVPKFRGTATETLLGMFDGQASSTGGSKLAKYLHENFAYHFTEELGKLKTPVETPSDALRRTFLALNKDLATAASQTVDEKEHRNGALSHRASNAAQTLSADDLNSGGVATVMFLDNMELYMANVGDAQAMLMHSDGGFKILTRKHDPALPSERQRIREAGGYVSRHGKLNDVLDVSRAFGYIQMMPAVMAAPNVSQVTLKEQDEMVLIASRELWDYLTPDVVVDVARSERGDLMRAAQKLRDLAMAFGATGKIMVMMIGVSDLKKREYNRYRGQSLSMGPSQMQDEQIFPSKRGKRPRDGPDDSTLQRLDPEVDAPTGDVGIIFTDIKNSTALWESYPVAMRSAIRIHNAVMRRQLRIIGGYEVKTEGDAFMVSFPTATSALLWCFSVQSHLLEAPWPSEILNSVHCQEVLDGEGNVVYRGLSVRMGIHWGNPVCEPDPVTRRMDYFGPMVNRASRISGVADGGQINVSSDFIAEIHRTLETYAENGRSSSTGSDETLNDDGIGQAIRRELRSLSSQGFEVKDLGLLKLKGLENAEYVYMMYPHSLAGRLAAQQQPPDAQAREPAATANESKFTIERQDVWDLWNVCLRLEMLCSALQSPDTTRLKSPETAMLDHMKSKGEVTDRFLLNIVEHQVTRIEVSRGIP